MNHVRASDVATTIKHFILVASLIFTLATFAQASIIISEVDPTGSSNTTYKQDWFELTNTGSVAQDITGWKMDDNSHDATLAVLLRGATSIVPDQSVVFIEDGTDSTKDAALDATFINSWFGTNVPAGLTVANYGGSGVGLGSSGDEVNIYDASGNLVTGVAFGSATQGVSFDNAAGVGSSTLPDPTISTISVAGVNGAFVSPTGETGSPAVVPEPGSALLLCVGAGLLLASRMAKSRSAGQSDAETSCAK